MHNIFRKVAQKVSNFVGTSYAFIIALMVIVVWLISGPIYAYSDTWQLVINTGTTIVTFLMVFLIQNTQNRETRALHIKLDELILAQNKAKNSVMAVENLEDEKLDKMEERYMKLAKK